MEIMLNADDNEQSQKYGENTAIVIKYNKDKKDKCFL